MMDARVCVHARVCARSVTRVFVPKVESKIVHSHDIRFLLLKNKVRTAIHDRYELGDRYERTATIRNASKPVPLGQCE